MKLKKLFDLWGAKAEEDYADKQWLLSKWEVNEGIDWPEEKTEALIKSLKNGLKPTKDDSLIELGCAGGWILELLSSTVKEYYGLDFSMEMLKFASKELKNSHLISGDIGQLPLKDNQFDCILSYYVFMNFDDAAFVQRAIREIHRVLNKGGRALIGQLPDKDGSSRYEQAREDYFNYCSNQFSVGKSIREEFKPPLCLFSKDELRSFLNKENISYDFQESFNPFYFKDQPQTVDWRFDLILTKTS